MKMDGGSTHRPDMVGHGGPGHGNADPGASRPDATDLDAGALDTTGPGHPGPLVPAGHVLHPQRGPHGRRVGNQSGALCFRRRAGRIEVLLVTSRNTGRWVVPKGWPMRDRSPSDAARIEAWEEAGVRGKISSASLGLYAYVKRADDRWPRDTPCVVTLYPLQVRELARHYPERHERTRDWFALDAAAGEVEEAGLSRLIRSFRPELYFAAPAGGTGEGGPEEEGRAAGPAGV